MRLSVIVTLYNTADYAEACIRSILGQDPADTELILIDDGSADASWDTCRRLAATDARIRIARQTNQGPSAARNHGLALATGEYVTFVDGDDTLAPGTLSHCTSLLKAHQPDLLIFSMQHLTGDDANHTTENLVLKDNIHASAASALAGMLSGQRLLLYSAANKFYRRSFLAQHGLRFAPGVDFGEDRLFNYACLHRARRLVTSSHLGYRYHIRPRPSLSQKYRRRHIDTLLQLHDAKQALVDTFVRHHPQRDGYLARDFLREISAAIAHLQRHWSGLSFANRYREVRHLCHAGGPPHWERLPCPTLSRKIARCALKHRWTPLLYLCLSRGVNF